MQEDYYQVEQIIGKQVKKGKVFYFVKWKGYNREQSTWEREEDLGNCRELVEAYEFQMNNKNQQSQQIQNQQGNIKEQTIPQYYKGLMMKKKDTKGKRKKRQKKQESSIEIEEIIEEVKTLPKKVSKDKKSLKKKEDNLYQKYTQFYNSKSHQQMQITNKEENIRIDKVIIQDTIPYFQAYDLNLQREIGFITYDFMMKRYPQTLKTLTVKQLQFNSVNN